MPPTSSPDGLSDGFRAFYARAARLRRRIEAVPPAGGDGATDAAAAPTPAHAPASTPAATAPATTAGAPAATTLELEREPLVTFLQQFEADGHKLGTKQAGVYRQAQYVMAAWADEVFTRLTWPFAGAWKKSTLEFLLFQTNDAGTVVFQRIDKLLQVNDPGQRDLAKLYLMVLSLGFRGTPGKAPAGGDLAKLRARLRSFAWPDEASTPPALIFPEAYRHTLGNGAGHRLPGLKRWAVLALLTLVAVVALSFPVWWSATGPIAELVARILAL